jgi:hypothetical protein
MQSGRLIQSSYGTPKNPGNFEALVLEGTNLVHYWRNNSDPKRPWIKGPIVSRQASGDASLIQSSYVGKPGSPANFEAVVLEKTTTGNKLVHYWRDNSNGNVWNRTQVITDKATGPGALIQSTYGNPGNFEVVVPEGKDLVHYWRDNTNGSVWKRGPIITSSAASAASLIQSSYKGNPGAPGNFELVVIENGSVVHYWRDNSNGNVWHRQDVITAASQNGPGTLIQGSYGSPGNFELLVTEGSTVSHFWRDNSHGNKWQKSVTVANAVDGPASLIQSTYGTPANPGNLEAIVVRDGNNLDHYWRDDSSSGRPWALSVTISNQASG